MFKLGVKKVKWIIIWNWGSSISSLVDSVAAELQFISARFVRFSGPIRVVLWFNFRNIMYVKEQKCYCLSLCEWGYKSVWCTREDLSSTTTKFADTSIYTRCRGGRTMMARYGTCQVPYLVFPTVAHSSWFQFSSALLLASLIVWESNDSVTPQVLFSSQNFLSFDTAALSLLFSN